MSAATTFDPELDAIGADLVALDELEALCPYCGEPLDPDFLGADVFAGADGVDALDWAPHCPGMADDVEAFGVAEVLGQTLESVASTITGTNVREVFELDGILRRPLEVLAPGQGVKGWRAEVFADVAEHHRHHDPPQGWKFGVAVYNGRARVGVAVVGRPVSRKLAEADPGALEVTRVCTWGDRRLRRNAASKLYAAAAREAKKLGATKLVTYTLETENGSSLKASGFAPVAKTKGGRWDRPSRNRATTAPTCRKVRWERSL